MLVLSSTPEPLRGLSEMLAREGTAVDAVTEGAMAFQLVWDNDYDVIIAEIGIPDIDGRDLYMAFKHTRPELIDRMIFVCAEPTAAIAEFVAGTRVPLVRAPVSLVELCQALRAARAGPRPRAFVSLSSD